LSSGKVKTKTLKMVFDAASLKTQH
jgi:hypothetical protein